VVDGHHKPTCKNVLHVHTKAICKKCIEQIQTKHSTDGTPAASEPKPKATSSVFVIDPNGLRAFTNHNGSRAGTIPNTIFFK
jgi:hypothetical protein